MTWAIAVGAAISVVSGIAGARSKKKAEKKAAKERMKMIDVDYQNSLKQDELEAGLEDYYNQLESRERALGGLNYGAYSTVNEFAPEYQSTATLPEIPIKPTVT